MSLTNAPLGASSSKTIEIPRITTVDRFATESTGEFVEAWQQIFDDPSGLVVRPHDSEYIENHVVSAADDGVILKAGLFPHPKTETEAEALSQTSVLQAIVVNRNDSIDMHFSIEQRNLRYYDLEHDSFTSMILGYFKAHIQARREHIARSALIPQSRPS